MTDDPREAPGASEDWSIDLEFANNPEPRCPCVLLLDSSGSMSGDRITALNQGIITFRDGVLQDPLAPKRVEIAVISFGQGVRVIQDFVTVDSFAPPVLDADGRTPMGSAILRALDLLDVRKEKHKANGIEYYRPWLFLITDGAPQGEPEYVMEQATARIKEAQQQKRVAFFAIGVQDADMARLAQLTVQRPPLRLKGLQFIELFRWLSTSLTRVSQSRPGDEVQLPPPGWGSVT
jgi:uncharacterized protein YegL